MEYSEEAFEKYEKAGKIAAQALQYGKTLIKKDAYILEVTKKITAKIKELGGELAFPVNISLNEQAAHNSASINDNFKFDDELVKLDVGVHVDGFIGDTALTVDLSGKYTALVKASEDALNNAINAIKPGITVGEIGKIIEETITKAGFQPVRNLSGHGLEEYQAHAEPNIPNFNTGDDTPLEEGEVVAIEPFATNGIGMIEEKGHSEIFSMVGFKPVRVNFVRNILKHIGENYRTLPFSKLMLSEKFSEAQINYAIKNMESLEMVRGYPPLVERQKGFVSQHEHTIFVDSDNAIVLTKI